MQPRRNVLAPDWYAEAIGAPLVGVNRSLRERFPPWLVRMSGRRPLLRGVLIFLNALRTERLALVKKAPGTGTVLILSALLRRRQVILLEFLPRPQPRTTVKRLAHRMWMGMAEKPAVRRSMIRGHVLTEREGLEYAQLYRLSPDRFRHVRWALCRKPAEPPPFPVSARRVVASGRVSCDWETLFAAADLGSWPLTVICGRHDLRHVEALNHRGRAEILCELPRDEHDQRLRAAAVYVLPLMTDGPSAGHVRLMAATGAGIAVVATRVPGLDGYVKEGETALLVPPGDSVALATSIDRLLANPAERRSLRDAAFERAKRWSYREYFKAMRMLVLDAPEP